MFKAAVLVAQNQPLEIVDCKIPSLKYGQVLVKMKYAGICGSQLGEISGVRGPDSHLPHLLGHEGSGIVVETGPYVKRIKEGDHVVLHWRKTDGIESEPPRYGKYNAGWVTTFNEMAVVSENRVSTLVDGAEFRKAALFGCTIPTAFAACNRLEVGQAVVIVGLGAIGMAQVMIASKFCEVFGYDQHRWKEVKALDFGSDNYRVKAANVVIDNTGNADVIKYWLPRVEKIILVGVPSQEVLIDTYSLQMGKHMIGISGGEPKMMIKYQRLDLPYNDLITHEFDLEHINDALDVVRNGEAIKCLIRF